MGWSNYQFYRGLAMSKYVKQILVRQELRKLRHSLVHRSIRMSFNNKILDLNHECRKAAITRPNAYM